ASPAITNIAWSSNPVGLISSTVINPTVTLTGQPIGVYTVYLEVTDANGCVSDDSVYVTLTSGPSISAGADQYICEGESVTLVGSGGSGPTTYSWYSDTSFSVQHLLLNHHTITVSPTVTTTYYLRVNNPNCPPALSSAVTVYVHPATPVFFDGLATDYCEEDAPVTLTNVSPLGGTWSGIGVNQLGVFDPGAVTTMDVPITITYSYADSTAPVIPLDPFSFLPAPICVYEYSMTTTVWSNPVVAIDTLDPVCADAASFPVTDFHGASAGGSYEINGVAAVTVSPAALGAGLHDVWYFYTNMHGCTDSAMSTFEVWPLPVKQALFAVSPTNGGHFCDGDSAEIFMNTSESDVVYDLYLDGGIVTFYNVATVNGTGGYLSFGKFAGDGDYYVIGTKMVTGCTAVASDTVTLTKEELPQIYGLIASNGGHYCKDGACETASCTGVQIGMYSTNPEDRYDLFKIGSPDAIVATMMGNAISGTGQWFPGTFTAGQYYVIAYDISTPANCPQYMGDTVTVTEDPKPVVQLVTKNNVCQCPHESTIISIDSAQLTVDYVLYDPSMNPVDTINGVTSFAPVKPTGVYTVIAYKRSNGTNPWYYGSSLLPNGNWFTVCVDTMGTIEVCEYIYASIDALRHTDLTPATPATMTIDGGEEGYLAVDYTVDSQPYSLQWQVLP
ncbi:MAG: hypothetical protein IH599_04155, partial [Bacteroidales bacterium]|nr:hypothetical protein [Bacteroidales bacterium]